MYAAVHRQAAVFNSCAKYSSCSHAPSPRIRQQGSRHTAHVGPRSSCGGPEAPEMGVVQLFCAVPRSSTKPGGALIASPCAGHAVVRITRRTVPCDPS